MKKRPVRGDAAKGTQRLRRMQLPLVVEEKWRGEGLAAAGAAEEARTVRSPGPWAVEVVPGGGLAAWRGGAPAMTRSYGGVEGRAPSSGAASAAAAAWGP